MRLFVSSFILIIFLILNKNVFSLSNDYKFSILFFKQMILISTNFNKLIE